MDFKYPSTVWSDEDRRDIMVNLLEGQAKMLYRTLPNRVKQGSFEGIVKELRAARNNPCERLQLLEQWDTLRKKDTESVNEFCFRMESLSGRLHAESDRDFLLASKLHHCLSHWRDSYHMLAELDRPEGDAYEAVKRAALRLERAQQARSARRDGVRNQAPECAESRWRKRRGFRPESESRRATKEHDLAQKETTAKKCFKCGEVGHLAAGCPKPKENGDRPTKHKPSLGRERRTPPKPKAGSFSAYVKGWCGEVREDVAGNETEAYGEPCLCDVTVMGIKAKAMIDTGSIISILPLGLLRQALKSGSPLDEMVTMLGAGNDRKVFDASGNEMRFLMLVATHVDVHGGGSARVHFHIHESPDSLILLGTNALKQLDIKISAGRCREVDQ
ncbi:zinc knuckle, partial [Oesophagostomum dentatum]